MTKVVHCKKEPYDVYIGRPGPFGNPYIIGVHGDRKKVIALYKEWVRHYFPRETILALDGKTLGCWCHPLPCHGDALIELIEEYKNDR